MMRNTPTMRLAVGLVGLLSPAQCTEGYTPRITTSPHRWPQQRSPPSSRLSASTLEGGGPSAAASAATSSSADDGDDDGEDRIKTRDLLSLDYIRSTLIRQEETIIFSLIERAQFRRNDVCYRPGGLPGLGVPPGSIAAEDDDEELSFLEFMLTGTASC